MIIKTTEKKLIKKERIMENKKIIAFDTFRFFMSIAIILHHIGINIYSFHNLQNNFFMTADLAVECFFILSGFLLALNFSRIDFSYNQSCDVAQKFFFKKIKRLWPEYIVAMLLCALLTNMFSHHISMNTFLLNSVMMAGWGNIPNIINGIWYVTVFFWGSVFLYSLLCFYQEKAKMIFIPLIALICLFYLVNHGGNISRHQQCIEFQLLSKGTIRGLLGLCCGIFCFEICEIIKNLKVKFRPKILNLILLILEITATILLFNTVILRKQHNIADFNVYFYAGFLVSLFYFKKERFLSFMAWKGWEQIAYLSYTLYLTHLIVLEILRVHWKQLSYMSPWMSYPIIIFLSLLFAIICYHLQKWLFAKLKDILFVNTPQTTSQNISGEH